MLFYFATLPDKKIAKWSLIVRFVWKEPRTRHQLHDLINANRWSNQKKKELLLFSFTKNSKIFKFRNFFYHSLSLILCALYILNQKSCVYIQRQAKTTSSRQSHHATHGCKKENFFGISILPRERLHIFFCIWILRC